MNLAAFIFLVYMFLFLELFELSVPSLSNRRTLHMEIHQRLSYMPYTAEPSYDYIGFD